MKKLQDLAGRPVLWLACTCALMLWPAFYNGQPFFNTDTSAYIRAADAAIGKLTSFSTAWADPQAPGAATEAPAAPVDPGTGEGSAAAGTKAEPALSERTILVGRSIYYGALLYVGYLLGNFWFTVFLQALVMVWMVRVVLKTHHLEPGRAGWTATALLALTPATAAVSSLSPDIFAAVTILTCSLLLLPSEKRPTLRFVLALLLLASLLFHSSHLLIAAGLLGLGVTLAVLRPKWVDRKGMASILLMLLLAYAGEAAFIWGVTRVLGQSPVRPPFLMARLVEDGPGYRLLRDTCPGNGYVACQFIDRLPLTANEFLWAEGVSTGVFAVTDPPTRRRLSEEQGRFAWAVFQREPAAVLRAAFLNAWSQATAIGVPALNYSPSDSATILAKAPPDTARGLRASAAYGERMPVAFMSAASAWTAVVSLLVIAVVSIHAFVRRRTPERTAVLTTTYILAGIAGNAFICGALAAPFDRYQARVIWLLPLAALVFLGATMGRSERGATP